MWMTLEDAKYIEGYAAALVDLNFEITGEYPMGKSYDPMTVDGNTMHSYVFDMKDGGRHHPARDYKDLEEIKEVLLKEAAENMRYDIIHSAEKIREEE